ncbi:T9SS type A sorting domain-containing protein [Saccharicrinis sp. FJH54]|uniref:T9SS type A sorting domain-containing protein n=1 Tax=Saccharicrinis sp. FJH54 TaxID=3344665 RepID=UPI0035D4312C
MHRMYRVLTLAILFVFSAYIKGQTVSENDSLALVALYNSTGGENWVKSDNWLTGNVNTWYGIVCEDQKVKAINLSGNNLKGILPDEIYALTDLRYIYISFNQVSGTLKEDLGNLNMLEVFWASNNQLTGHIPGGIGSVDSLKTLYLNNNQFDGSVPATIGSLQNLENINLSTNSFSGALPHSLGDLINLRYLILDHNAFTDSVPDELVNLTKLKTLKLDNNYFTYVPDLTSLTRLVNTPLNVVFTLHTNYFCFVDLKKNLSISGDESNYYPQRIFPLTTLKNLHPGDSVYVNLPALSFVDTSDSKTTFRYLRDSKLIQDWSANSGYSVHSATYADNGSYVCEVHHEDFPDMTLKISNVRLLPPSGYSWLSFGVKIDGPLLDTIDYDIVALKKTDGVFNSVSVKDTTMNQRKEFLIPTGTYLFNLIPKGNDSVLMTRYHKNSIRWVNNQESVLGNRKDYAFNVSFIPKIYAQGIGSVAGTVNEIDAMSSDAGASGRAGKLNAMVLLYSVTDGRWINQQLTDVNGNYRFAGLDEGEYSVYVDFPGFAQDEVWKYNVTAENPDFEGINFTMYLQDNVITDIIVPQFTQSDLKDITVFTDNLGQVHVQSGLQSGKNAAVYIFDLSGKKMYAQHGELRHETILPTQLEKGIYILQIVSGENKTAKKFMVR